MDPAAAHIDVLGHADLGVTKVVSADPGRYPLVVDSVATVFRKLLARQPGRAQLIADLPPLTAEVARVAPLAPVDGKIIVCSPRWKPFLGVMAANESAAQGRHQPVESAGQTRLNRWQRYGHRRGCRDRLRR